MGVLADIFGIMRSFAITSFVLAIGFFAIVFIAPSSVTLFLAVMSFAGFIVGAFNTVLTVALIAGWGEVNYGLTMGIFGIGAAVMNFVGPQMSVRLDIDMFLIAGGIFSIIGGLLSFVVIKTINKQVGYKVLK